MKFRSRHSESKARRISALIISLLIMTGSFANAQDDQGITDDQVFQEMTQYLHALNGGDVEHDKFQQQLEFLKKIKYLWKEPQFIALRSKSLEALLTTQKQNSYFLSALAFRNEDIRREIYDLTTQTPEGYTPKTYCPNISLSDEDKRLIQNALQFREELKEWDKNMYSPLYRLQVPHIPDILSFSPKSTYLVTVVKKKSDGNPLFANLTHEVQIWNLNKLQKAPESNILSQWSTFAEPTAIAFNSSETKIAVGIQRGAVIIAPINQELEFDFLHIVEIETNQNQSRIPITSLAFAHHSDLLLVGRANGTIQLYHENQLIQEFQHLGYPDSTRIYNMSFTADDRLFYYENGMGFPFLRSLSDGAYIEQSNPEFARHIQEKIAHRFTTPNTHIEYNHKDIEYSQKIVDGQPLWNKEAHTVHGDSESGFGMSVDHSGFHPTEPWLFFIEYNMLFRMQLETQSVERFMIPYSGDHNLCQFKFNANGNLFAISKDWGDLREVVIYGSRPPDLRLILLVDPDMVAPVQRK